MNCQVALLTSLSVQDPKSKALEVKCERPPTFAYSIADCWILQLTDAIMVSVGLQVEAGVSMSRYAGLVTVTEC